MEDKGKVRKTSGIVFDQYYTKGDIAVSCCRKLLDIFGNDYFNGKTFLEPSAGTGAFVAACRSVFGDASEIEYYDIEPKLNGTIHADFLKTEIGRHGFVTIGNPPFGNRSSLAIAFFNKASEISDVVAFIVPVQFEKFGVQKKLDKDFALVFSEKLPANSFENNGREYSVRCVFQIWTRTPGEMEDMRLKKAPATSHPDFEMFLYNNTPEAYKYFDKKKYGWDFAVPRQGYYDYSLRITDEKDLSRKVQYMFFKAEREDVLRKLSSMDFAALSMKNTTTPGFGKADVVREYIAAGSK